ncbi:gliding motility lipoprotein GldH [Pedobacter endophyticus]|uniref:Gliding motility lipoprotein GldH n=1 Tax=Pedobacter endophyticus TaxID=2789740 RepID=A0A7U3Q5J3_9SPHI|nr:gliding motility lipoprotein GldH [Pedobacter endophyticus]QPH38137.1 gliding motility lipoprotein GldH [Pedobacter endophyticus]
MAQRTNLLPNKTSALVCCALMMITFLAGCTNSIIDSNVELDNRRWSYRNHIANSFEIKESSTPYNIYFKLRVTANYKYSNIFILAHFKDGNKVVTRRYQYKLAKNDGEWLGSGSGNVFSYTLPMLTNYRFAHNGKFTIEIEQNMRDNPLLEVSDAGILIENAE